MNRQFPGFLISFEGGEGCGKTTQIRKIVDSLREKGLNVFPTREPGGTSIGEQIRAIVHDQQYKDIINTRSETLLYQTARVQTVEEVLIPRLKNGEIVILDRFWDSTMAYQGYGRQQNINMIKQLVDYATGGLTPDLTVWMDVDVRTGLSRRKGSEEWNRMDGQSQEFHERVRQGYLQMYQKDPRRWIRVDANQGVDEVFRDLKSVIEKRLAIIGIIECDGNRGPER